MEREIFEDAGWRASWPMASSVKVDREGLPDVDHVYMSALQAPTGRGVCRKAVVDGRRLLAEAV